MSSILVYALPDELQTIVDHFNDDPDVAFVVSSGPRRWRAVERVDRLPAGQHAVWLRCGGALPLVGPDVDGGADVPIPDPMRGWEERVPASTPGVPFFGSHPAVIWIHVPVFDGAPELPMTAIGWIGDRYRGIGQGAPEAAQRWWRRLQRWIAARSERVRRGGPAGIGPNDVAAFPEALAKLRAGALGAINPPVP